MLCMKLKTIVVIILSFCCIFSLPKSIVLANEEWEDEYTYTNGKYDFYGSDIRTRKVYSGYERSGEFYLSDGIGAVYIANRVRGVYSNGKTKNLYYVPQLGFELDDSTYEVNENLIYNPALTLVLKRNCQVFILPDLYQGFNTGKIALAGEYKVTRRNLYWMEITLKDGSKGWIMPQYSDKNEYYSNNYAYFKEALSTVSVSNINGIPIYQKMMPIHEDRRTGIAQAPKYVTIHNTANEGAGANALSHANYQINNTTRVASWHYTVDQSSIYQSMPINEVAWHAGDGGLMGNSSTVAIEICENSDGNYAKSEYNAALLTARILYDNKLPSNAVKLHKDWSGKHCAHNIIDVTKGSMGWERFKQVVIEEYNKIAALEDNENNNSSNTNYSKGDVNGDGKVNSLDYVQIENHIMQRKRLLGNSLQRADVNGDGKVNSLDYVQIENHIMGRKPLF